jgi:hypothetical protein
MVQDIVMLAAAGLQAVQKGREKIPNQGQVKNRARKLPLMTARYQLLPSVPRDNLILPKSVIS